jgi:hypothetical protein
VILAPAVVFAVTGDAPQTLVLAVLGLAVSAARRRPLTRNTRSFVYTGLVAVVAATLSEQLLPVDAKHFFWVPANVYCPPVILLAVAITYLDQRDSNISAVIGLSLLAMMMAGNCMDFDTPYRRLPMRPGMFRYLHAFYGAAVALQLTACIGLMARAPYALRHPAAGPHRRGLRLAITVGFVALAAAGTLAMRPLAKRFERIWQSGFVNLVQRRMRQQRDQHFGREVDLWQALPAQSSSEATVVLRALSPQPPGYLRARAYTNYQDGRWAGAGRTAALPFEQPGGHLAYSVFRRLSTAASPGAATSRTDLYPARGFRSDVLFVPGTADTFEIIADTLGSTEHGELTPTEWEPSVGYTAVGPEGLGSGAYDGPADDGEALSRCLDLPPELREPLAALGREAFSGPGGGGASSALAALDRFFRQDFQYLPDTRPERAGGDPVLQFLRRKTGHCELFATATVLLLRSQGIPARYVTGLVCLEGRRGLWLARLADAHAWAEAYDVQARRWLLVEMTPATGIPSGKDRAGFLSEPLGYLAFSWQHVLALMKRGTVAEAIVAAAKALVQALGWLVLNPVGAPLAALVLILLARRWRKGRRQRLGLTDLPPARERLRAVYAGLLPALRRVLSDVPAQPTPGLVAGRIRALLPSIPEPILAAALARYEFLRYGSRLPTEAEIRALRREFRLGLTQVRQAPRAP